MPKTIPIALAEHEALPATTLCFLQKIGPLPLGGYIALTSLDRDVIYDDGGGELTYYAGTGMDASQLSATNDLGVDNGETNTLVPIYPGQGITKQMVNAGDLDGVEFIVYKVNYSDLSDGHEIMASGVIGEVKMSPGGLVTFENRSWSQLLKQNSVVELDSLTCRAKFGSTYAEQRHPCLYDLSGEWVAGEVSGLGTEVVRDFFAPELTQPDDYFAPGLVRWLTGENVGQENEVARYFGPDSDTDGAVELQFTTRYPIEIGDTFEIRRDCTKWWSGHNSCETYNNRQWFRGEPFIPISDVTGLTMPGAAYGFRSVGPAADTAAM